MPVDYFIKVINHKISFLPLILQGIITLLTLLVSKE